MNWCTYICSYTCWENGHLFQVSLRDLHNQWARPENWRDLALPLKSLSSGNVHSSVRWSHKQHGWWIWTKILCRIKQDDLHVGACSCFDPKELGVHWQRQSTNAATFMIAFARDVASSVPHPVCWACSWSATCTWSEFNTCNEADADGSNTESSTSS